MAERDPEKQSSVLFSLRELMNLEEERIQTEKQRDEEARAAENRAKMEAELRLRAAEEARIRAEEERRRNDAAREREEAARLEAIRHAEIERARLQAEEHARLAQLELSHKHEREIQLLRADKEKTGLRRALIGVALASFVVAGGGLGYWFGVAVPKAEAEKAQAENEARQLKEARDKAQAEAAAKEKQIADLTDQRNRAQTEKERLELDAKLRELKGDKDVKDQKPPPGGGPLVKPPPPPGPGEDLLDKCRNSKDPTCGM
jgi:colicin import membrane protein